MNCIVCGSKRVYENVCWDCGAVQPAEAGFTAYDVVSAGRYNTPTPDGELGSAPVDLHELHLDSLRAVFGKSGRARKIEIGVNRAIGEMNASLKLRGICRLMLVI